MLQPIGRSRRGGTLALVAAIVATFGLALLFFALHYSQQMGSYQEQKSAIEAAALAAARDLGRIVLEDPNIGFVALSDYAPKGNGTLAKDGYATPVHGINTVLATARLDLILADYMQDPVMQALAQNDYNNALAARQALADHLTQIIQKKETGLDYENNVVDPLKDAITAYTNNPVRLEGGKAQLVPGSLQLSLGFVQNSQTSRAPLPQPISAASVPHAQQWNSYYLPNVQIMYKGKNPIVFAALGADADLADFKTFSQAINVSNATPTVIQAVAQEKYNNPEFANTDASHVVTVRAAAEAGAIIDQLPNPGQFTLTFQNGPLTQITTLGDIFNQSQMATDPTDVLQSPSAGDYPETPLSSFSVVTVPGQSKTHPQFTYLISVAFYDWLRRAGSNVNVTQLMQTLGKPLNYSGNGGQTIAFQVQPNGSIKSTVNSFAQTNLCVSQNQWRAISGLGLNTALTSNPAVRYYDLQLTDFVYQEGRIKGGMHAGEPLPIPGILKANPNGKTTTIQTMWENTTWSYQSFQTASGSVLRPTYQNPGAAVDLTFRLRP